MDINIKLQELEASSHGDYWIVRCPVCGHKEAYIYLDDVEKHRQKDSFKIPIRCNRLNKCGKTSYIEDVVISQIPRINDDDIIGISSKGIEKLNNLAHLSIYLKEFEFDWRGISNRTLKENGVIYIKDGLISFMKGCGRGAFADRFFKNKNYNDRNLIFPIKDYNGNCERMLLRSINTHDEDEKYKKEIGMRLVKKSSEVWNRKDLISPAISTIFITEGVPDGLSIKEVSPQSGVISLPGVKKYRQIIREIENHKDAQSKRYIICFDNDEAGANYITKLAKEFDEYKIQYEFFDLNGYKDVNEFLQSNRELFIKTVNKYSKKTFRFIRKASIEKPKDNNKYQLNRKRKQKK